MNETAFLVAHVKGNGSRSFCLVADGGVRVSPGLHQERSALILLNLGFYRAEHRLQLTIRSLVKGRQR
jgi:hypothetical protein